jgi:lysine-ketoglutarate reductase/saccharopine dehydrogenase-like protein (TIGR00300 family)
MRGRVPNPCSRLDRRTARRDDTGMAKGSTERAVFEAQGHLIDTGALTRALDAVVAAGARYRLSHLEIGETRDQSSRVELELTAPDRGAFERAANELLGLGFCPGEPQEATLEPAPQDGVAPEGFYSTTNLDTQVRVGGRWLDVERQRMDAVIVVAGGRAVCRKLRDVRRRDPIVVGLRGIRLAPPLVDGRQSGFSFMSGPASSERKLAAQVRDVAAMWRDVRARGRKVVLVVGPVVVHVGAAPALARVLAAGVVDGLLSGNALAVHDCEAALFNTSLGVDLDSGRTVAHGHMHHMRAINRIRQAGGLEPAVRDGVLRSGVMRAAIEAGVPFCLAGSIRDDGPLPDTEMDLVRAQERYAEILEGAGLVVILGSMLHGIGVGNMIPASVATVCVDIHPAVVAKLADRGTAQSLGVVTDVGAFLEQLAAAELG